MSCFHHGCCYLFCCCICYDFTRIKTVEGNVVTNTYSNSHPLDTVEREREIHFGHSEEGRASLWAVCHAAGGYRGHINWGRAYRFNVITSIFLGGWNDLETTWNLNIFCPVGDEKRSRDNSGVRHAVDKEKLRAIHTVSWRHSWGNVVFFFILKNIVWHLYTWNRTVITDVISKDTTH